MDDLLESYVNGNISYVKEQLINEPYSLSDLYNAYIDACDPTPTELMLFVLRLA